MPSAPHADSRPSAPSSYYWAGGRRITLTPSRRVAVDLVRAGQSHLSAKQIQAIRKDGQPIHTSLVTVDHDRIQQPERAELESVRALQPVYRAADDTLIVVLPELRVETDDPAQLRSYVARNADELGATLREQGTDRFTITLENGDGDDALRLANDLVESHHPRLAQARFVRLAKRPATR